MTALVLAAAAAAGLLTWAHLRPAGARRPVVVASLQHVQGAPSLRWRRLLLEERVAFGVRLGALLLALAGVWIARVQAGRGSAAIWIVDPDLGAAALEAPRGGSSFFFDFDRRPSWIGFDGEEPRAGGEDAPALLRSLRGCGDTRPACLVRTAAALDRPLVVLAGFGGGWERALAGIGRPFSYVRREVTGVAAEPAVEQDTAAKKPAEAQRAAADRSAAARVRLTGHSAAARLWASALAIAADTGLDSNTAPPAVEVADASASRANGQGAASVVVVNGEGPAGEAHPAAQKAIKAKSTNEGTDTAGAVLADPLELAAGAPGLALRASLEFAADSRFQYPIGRIAAVKGKQVALAGSAEDLGRWAHEGLLLPLARAVLAALTPTPIEVTSAPAGGIHSWRRPGGSLAPVGLLDVPPGSYLRDDGRVRATVARPGSAPSTKLDDAALERLGGAPLRAAGGGAPTLPTALLAAALVFWLAGAVQLRSARAAALPFAGALVLLALLVADGARERAIRPERRAAVGATGPARTDLVRALSSNGLGVQAAGARRGCDGSTAGCEIIGAIELATAPPPSAAASSAAVPSAAAPSAAASSVAASSAIRAAAPTVLVFDPAAPRVDLLEVRAPEEVPLGAAAELVATVRVRRAAGQVVEVRARPSSAAASSAELRVSSADEVRAVRLSVTPLSAGLSFVAVEASVSSSPSAADARIVAVVARARPARRIVVAAAPGWEARAAADALEALRDGPALRLTRVGTKAVLAAGTLKEAPRTLLAGAALDELDTVVVVGFTAAELAGAPAAGLKRLLQRGGAVVLLGSPGAAAALGWPALHEPAQTLPAELIGRLEEGPELKYRGYPAARAPRLALGAEVLGTLAPKDGPAAPWLVGRAFGKGRLAVFEAPDLWRLSPPAGLGANYRSALLAAVAWAEAARAGRGATLSAGWDVLRDAAGAEVVLTDGHAGRLGDLEIDAVDPRRLTAIGRAQLRAAAARAHQPFLEVEGAQELAAVYHRLPPAEMVNESVKHRRDDFFFGLLAALVGAEALLRRSRRDKAVVDAEAGSR